MYILLSGYHPFDPLNNADDHEVAKRIIGGNFVTFDTPVWDRVSPLAKDLLMKLLSSNEGGRPSAPELLHHPWIAGNTDLSNEPLAEVSSLHSLSPLSLWANLNTCIHCRAPLSRVPRI